ncbi:unnamed protein product [Clavelina lepadiformis]|uniref:Uncharacterized protein n=1 Tax=Clavelina lepadiformis TaxID=159417 RepID=A0ABP0G691_CLALP
MLQTITHAEVQVKSKSKDSGRVWKHSSNKSRNVHEQVGKTTLERPEPCRSAASKVIQATTKRRPVPALSDKKGSSPARKTCSAGKGRKIDMTGPWWKYGKNERQRGPGATTMAAYIGLMPTPPNLNSFPINQ